MADVDTDHSQEVLAPAIRKSGGAYCCVVKCTNNVGRDSHRGIKFYRFPINGKDEARVEKWISRVNRREKDGSLWRPSGSSRLCSAHFVSGSKIDDPDSPDYIPTIFPTTGYVVARTQADLDRQIWGDTRDRFTTNC